MPIKTDVLTLQLMVPYGSIGDQGQKDLRRLGKILADREVVQLKRTVK